MLLQLLQIHFIQTFFSSLCFIPLEIDFKASSSARVNNKSAYNIRVTDVDVDPERGKHHGYSITLVTVRQGFVGKQGRWVSQVNCSISIGCSTAPLGEQAGAEICGGIIMLESVCEQKQSSKEQRRNFSIYRSEANRPHAPKTEARWSRKWQTVSWQAHAERQYEPSGWLCSLTFPKKFLKSVLLHVFSNKV